MTDTPLKLFNSLTRQLEEFRPVHEGEARVYSCGPTVYNYQHIGNMRAYVFADTLGRTLQWKGYKLTHVINITDVGHLTSDADEGEDKMERMAAKEGKSAWDIAKFYQDDFENDLARLNVQPKQHPRATEFVEAMIAWGEKIAPEHCYELDSGLYFDVTSVEDYGRLAGIDYGKSLQATATGAEEILSAAKNSYDAIFHYSKAYPQHASVLSEAERLVEDVRNRVTRVRRAVNDKQPFVATEQAALAANFAVEVASIAQEIGIGKPETVQKLRSAAKTFGRINKVDDKRNEADFAIWRKTPAGETRQMEWDSPWGKGAPGWHLECSVMGEKLLGFPFDIHTGGIDHREIHHPNEIAQNQAFCGCGGLDEATHSGAKIWMHNNFLVERSGKMSKSSGEFLRLQLLVDKGYHPLAYRMMCLQAHYRSELEFSWEGLGAALTRLKRIVMAVERLKDAASGAPVHPKFAPLREKFAAAMADDLNTPIALVALEEALAVKKVDAGVKRAVIEEMDAVLGLGLFDLSRGDLRLRPRNATITEEEIEAELIRRKEARVAKDFTTSDAIRESLGEKGVEVMDGDPLGWDWKL
ncbi:cysteine--tRNA ligase [Qipengyuania flava]|uniref:cysteine--tRNA ligase n=1 Tax=Qipengyuania flava TaxID=192812 RepID=UPI001ADCF59D|nr:cysteine--tRNA ligase [Qipengyuania flava]MBO9505476.1 cysteine--tRNA ligase [Qipengyuania flava]